MVMINLSERHFLWRWGGVCLLLLGLAACACPAKPVAPPTPIPGTLYVDAGQQLGTISPLVYGANFGPWSVVPYDLWPVAQESGITFLRYPGGEWGDRNALRPYHIDQLMTLAEMIGAEPHICVRLLDGTPEAAAELVRYANVEKEYNVRYWSIGNEPNLFPDYSIDQLNADWRAIAEAMEAVDPDIVLIGPNTNQFTGNPNTDPRDDDGRDWLHEFLLANGDMVDIVAVHRYPFPRGRTAAPATIEDLRANSAEWDTIIPNLRVVIQETTGRDLPIAIGEINSHWSHAINGEGTPDSFYNAIWWADVLGRLIRQRVDIVAYFSLQSPPTTGGFGLLATSEVRPTYYVYQIYQRFGSELLYAVSDDPDVSIYAAQREDGALTLVVVNLGSEEKAKPLSVHGFEIGGAAEVWLFDAEHEAEMIGTQEIASGDEITLPAQSISLYVFPQQ
jgi:hypothetical protein